MDFEIQNNIVSNARINKISRANLINESVIENFGKEKIVPIPNKIIQKKNCLKDFGFIRKDFDFLLTKNGKEKKPENDINSENYKKVEEEKTAEINEKYVLVLPTKKYNFIQDYLHEINIARFDTKKFSKKIKNLKSKIYIDLSTKEEFLKYKNEEIYITEGESALTECSTFLDNLDKKVHLKEIENIEELKMPCPKDIENWKNDDYIKKAMKKLGEKVKGKYQLMNFFGMKCTHDGEINALLNIIEDKSIKDYIFDKNLKYIGIDIRELDEKFLAVYINFAK